MFFRFDDWLFPFETERNVTFASPLLCSVDLFFIKEEKKIGRAKQILHPFMRNKDTVTLIVTLIFLCSEYFIKFSLGDF